MPFSPCYLDQLKESDLSNQVATKNEKQCGTDKSKCLKLRNRNLQSGTYPVNKNPNSRVTSYIHLTYTILSVDTWSDGNSNVQEGSRVCMCVWEVACFNREGGPIEKVAI